MRIVRIIIEHGSPAIAQDLLQQPAELAPRLRDAEVTGRCRSGDGLSQHGDRPKAQLVRAEEVREEVAQPSVPPRASRSCPDSGVGAAASGSVSINLDPHGLPKIAVRT